METVHYFVPHKNTHHGEAILKGFAALRAGSERKRLVRRPALHLIGGLQFGSLELLQEARAKKASYVFFDRAYLGGGPGTNRLRAVRDAYQQHWVDVKGFDADGGRAHWLGARLEPWRETRGAAVMVVPPGPAICRLFGLGDWEAQTLGRLRRCTDRPLVVSYKGDPKPLCRRLDEAWAVVTWSSNVAVEAVLAGVPAFVGPESAALPVATPLAELEARLEAPLLPAREAWLASLAWGQFELAEIASGFAWNILFGRGA